MSQAKKKALLLDASDRKMARFVADSKELFYFVSSLTMLKRHCESYEEAERIVASCGVEQHLVRI